VTKAEVTLHLKKFDKLQRAALEEVRQTISAALPGCKEVIKYGIPTFLVDDKAVIGFDGFRKHNSIFPYSGSFHTRMKDELEKYSKTKGSIHFDRDKAMPKGLLRKIVKERFRQMQEE
jgi:uncharacterized protein YdhG (YjbR/CyaY superfamily)